MRQDEYFRRALRGDISYEQAYAEVMNEHYRLLHKGELTAERQHYLDGERDIIAYFMADFRLKEIGYEFKRVEDGSSQYVLRQQQAAETVEEPAAKGFFKGLLHFWTTHDKV